MHRVLLFILCVATSSAWSGEPFPGWLAGTYSKTYKVRVNKPECGESSDEECDLADTEDKVIITKISKLRVRVSASISGDYGSSCSIDAEGVWDRHQILLKLAPSEMDRPGICTIYVNVTRSGLHELWAEPYPACSRYCGTRASLYTENLERQRGGSK
jgi:hypothetical protein